MATIEPDEVAKIISVTQTSEDPFEILGIDYDATEVEIKKSYRKLAVLLHPDKNSNMLQAEEAFKCVTQAYAVLLDPAKRQQLFLNRVSANPNEPISRKSGTNVYQNTDTVQYKMYNMYCNKLLKKIDETSPVVARRTLSPAVSRTATTPLEGLSPATKRKREEEEMVKGTKKLKITDLRSSTSTHHDESSSSEDEASDSSSRSQNSLRVSQRSSTEELSVKRGKSAVAGGPGAAARAAHSSPATTSRGRVSITDINQFIQQKIRQVKETQAPDDEAVRLQLFQSLQHKFVDAPGTTSSSTTANFSVATGNGQTGVFSSQVTTFSFTTSTPASPKVTPNSDLNALLSNYMSTAAPVITTTSLSSSGTAQNYNFLNPNDPSLLNSLRKSQTRTSDRPQASPVAVYSSPVSSAPSTPQVASPTVSHAGFDFNFFTSQMQSPKGEPHVSIGQNGASTAHSSFQATINNLLNDSTNTTLTSILTSPVSPPQTDVQGVSEASTDTSAPMTL